MKVIKRHWLQSSPWSPLYWLSRKRLHLGPYTITFLKSSSDAYLLVLVHNSNVTVFGYFVSKGTHVGAVFCHVLRVRQCRGRALHVVYSNGPKWVLTFYSDLFECNEQYYGFIVCVKLAFSGDFHGKQRNATHSRVSHVSPSCLAHRALKPMDLFGDAVACEQQTYFRSYLRRYDRKYVCCSQASDAAAISNSIEVCFYPQASHSSY